MIETKVTVSVDYEKYKELESFYDAHKNEMIYISDSHRSMYIPSKFNNIKNIVERVSRIINGQESYKEALDREYLERELEKLRSHKESMDKIYAENLRLIGELDQLKEKKNWFGF